MYRVMWFCKLTGACGTGQMGSFEVLFSHGFGGSRPAEFTLDAQYPLSPFFEYWIEVVEE